jgi:ABC-type dipeptide/oligopeptide/nickel transport system permease component
VKDIGGFGSMRFWEYIFRRILLALVTLIGLSIVIFYLSRVLPSDPGRLALGPYATSQQVAAYDHQLGLDKPIYEQYFLYLWNFIHGQWGMSIISHHNVFLDVEYYFPSTFELVTISIVITALIGVPLGVFAASRRGGSSSALVRLLWIIGVAVPPFATGIILQLIFGYHLNILPVATQITGPLPTRITGMILMDSLLTLNWPAFGSSIQHLILPEIALSITGVGQIAQLTYAGMLDEKSEDYYDALIAMGANPRALNFKYALRQALVPVLTVLGLLYASLIAYAFLIESVFSWGGLSQYAVIAMQTKDFNAIVATVLIIGLFYVVLNFVVDIVLGYVDPRMRLGGAE